MLGIAEVETVESVNHLEAMSEWASLGRLKVVFHLCIPASAIDVARRMASDYQVALSELWSYDNVGDQVRFTLIQRSPEAPRPAAPKPRIAPRKAGRSPGAAARARVASRTQHPAASRGTGRTKAADARRNPAARERAARSREERPRKAQRRR